MLNIFLYSIIVLLEILSFKRIWIHSTMPIN
nr:MAG TPA: hypothetical protein [Bacteriophage sp.]